MLLGAASDRFGRRPVLAGIYAGRSLVFAGFFLIRDNPTAIIAVALVGGITIAGTMSMTSALTADIYGRHSVGGILGVIFLCHQVGRGDGLVAGRRAVRLDGRLRRGLRPRGRGARGRVGGEPAHRRRLAQRPAGSPAPPAPEAEDRPSCFVLRASNPIL